MESLLDRIRRLHGEISPVNRLGESGIQALVRLFQHLQDRILNMNATEADAYARTLPGELSKHAVAEVAKASKMKKSPGGQLLDYLLSEVIDLASGTAERRMEIYRRILGLDPDEQVTITPYDIYRSITEDSEVSKVLTVPRFPFNLGNTPRNKLGRKFNNSQYEPDFIAGLDDYLDAFIQGVRSNPGQYIQSMLNARQIPIDSDPVKNQNRYISLVVSQINQSIQQYAREHTGQLLSFSDLIQVLSTMRS